METKPVTLSLEIKSVGSSVAMTELYYDDVTEELNQICSMFKRSIYALGFLSGVEITINGEKL